MRIIVLVLQGVLIGSVSAQGLPSHQCNVSVNDSEGAVIGGAHVHVYRDEMFGHPFEQTFVADALGAAHFSVIDGWYDICVMRGAFIPQCKEIHIDGKDFSVPFSMSVSAAMAKAIGDTFN